MAACLQQCSVVLLLLVISVTAMPAQEKTIDEIIMAASESSKDLDMIQVSQDGKVTIRKDGDMVLTPQQWKEFYGSVEAGEERAGLRDPRYQWPDKTLIYELEEGIFNLDEKGIIEWALADWERYTCLKIRPATPEDRNKIVVGADGGCSSYIGFLGGSQSLSLAKRCIQRDVILHEFGHAIGFHHEQSRPDRDDYVTIQEDNIKPHWLYSYQKRTREEVDSRGVAYDYRSIMHYGPWAFAIDSSRYTIVTKDPDFQEIIGRARDLSFRDIKGVNIMYRCSEHCSIRDSDCPGEGFVGKDCKCWCPGKPYELCDESLTTDSAATADIDGDDYDDMD